MKSLLKILPIFLIGLISCQNELTEISEPEIPSVYLENLSGVERDIMINILSSKFGGYRKGQPATRALNSFSLTPFVEDGDTLLYVAQYSDGWEIYSANQEDNMLILSSSTGHFDINDPLMPPAMKDIIFANTNISRNSTDDITVNKSWGAASLTIQDFENGKTTVKNKYNLQRSAIAQNDLPPGHWVLIETETIDSKEFVSPKLIKTKWGQSYPWFQYTPFNINSYNLYQHTLVGCVAVALSQYLYFTHYKDGIPRNTVTNATPTSNGLDYSFSGSSSSIWDQMAIDAYQNGTNEAALLLGYVGRKVNSQYGLTATGSGPEYSTPFLASIYNTSFSRIPLSYDYIVSTIDKGYPLISDARSNKLTNGTTLLYSTGHYFIIDQYKSLSVTTKYTYGWERDPWNSEDGDDPWESNDVDENGNVITWAYTNEIIKNYDYQWISMNWGYDGYYDSVFYSPTGSWEVENTIYNLDHYVHVREDLK
ncbi:MAG: C10 family peptidase [Muribaculaceae bacterium]|nr:C10 family peptidase [Muribaculaceae bacterium]